MANTANNTVSQVDGTLGETGVIEAAQGVVNGVAGPESPVGHAVDESSGAVGGLLDPHH